MLDERVEIWSDALDDIASLPALFNLLTCKSVFPVKETRTGATTYPSSASRRL
jgi:hypothetical protein